MAQSPSSIAKVTQVVRKYTFHWTREFSVDPQKEVLIEDKLY
jgi:hypothetical protein